MRNTLSIIVGILIGACIGIMSIGHQKVARTDYIKDLKAYSSVSDHERPADYVYDDETIINTEEWQRKCENEAVLSYQKMRAEYQSMWDAQIFLKENEIVIPEDVILLCETAGQVFNIEPELLEAICWVESTCNPNAVNGPCKGIMQISEQWHRERMKRLGVTSIFDKAGNIMVGADYLNELHGQYQNDVCALMVFNGDSRVGEYAKNGKSSEYANKVLFIADTLKTAHGK